MVLPLIAFLIMASDHEPTWADHYHAQNNIEFLSLEQCIEYTVKNNPSVRMQSKKIREALYSRKGIIISQYPSLDLLLNYGYEREGYSSKTTLPATNDHAYDFYEINLILSKDLYTGKKNRADIDQATLLWGIEKLNLLSVFDDLVYSVSTSFYDILYYGQQLTSIREYVGILKTDYEQIKQRFEIGDAARFELIMAKVKLQEQNSTLVSYQADLSNAKQQLATLMNMDTDIQFNLRGDLQGFLPAEEPHWVSAGKILDKSTIQNRPHMKILSLRQAVIENEILVENAAYKPTLSGIIELQTNTRSALLDVEDNQKNTVSAMIMLTVPLMEKIKAGPRIKAKREAGKALVSEKKILGDQIEADAREAVRDLHKEKRKFTVVKENMALLENATEMVREAYRAGSMTLLDVQQVTLSYIMAKMDFNSIIHAMAIADLKFKNLSGFLITPEIKELYQAMLQQNHE